MLNHIDLFAGVGAFSLGLRRTGGFRTVCYVEQSDYCCRVLQARMADGSLDSAPIHPDIRTFPCGPFAGLVDVVTGGFPCQDVSHAGDRAGLEGERSGLWGEMLRVIREVRPAWVVAENVAALCSLGLDTVLQDLAESGFDAEWQCLPACSFGAPHIRDRVFILAYPLRKRCHSMPGHRGRREVVEGAKLPAAAAIPLVGGVWDEPPRRFVGMADGDADRLDRIQACGNSIVPQITEWIGRRILMAERI